MADTLYDRDLQAWLEQTIAHLKNREFESLDTEHLIEELIDLGKSDKSALKSNLTILLAHLLKLTVQKDAPDTMKGNWYGSALEHRQRVLDQLTDTPSLKSFLDEALAKAYPSARKLAIQEGKLAQFGVVPPEDSAYPQTSPFRAYPKTTNL
jgi:hypothetical protein